MFTHIDMRVYDSILLRASLHHNTNSFAFSIVCSSRGVRMLERKANIVGAHTENLSPTPTAQEVRWKDP